MVEYSKTFQKMRKIVKKRLHVNENYRNVTFSTLKAGDKHIRKCA